MINAVTFLKQGELSQAELFEAVDKYLLMERRKSSREGRTMLSTEHLPPCSYYCAWCAWPCFALPADQIGTNMPVFCEICDWLFGFGWL